MWQWDWFFSVFSIFFLSVLFHHSFTFMWMESGDHVWYPYKQHLILQFCVDESGPTLFSLGQEYFAVGHSRQESARVTVFEN
jgi:hypothetical protein